VKSLEDYEMKTFLIEAYFPEAIAHRAHQSCRKEATTLPLAVKRGIEELLKRNGVKGKRIHNARITVTVLTSRADEQTAKPGSEAGSP
jgi:hypothetical protein